MTSMRTGITTGTCAAAAAQAAAQQLCGHTPPSAVELTLPRGQKQVVQILYAKMVDNYGEAAVIKDAGDDPDITDGARIIAQVAWSDTPGVTFRAGPGVGTITRPGLQIPPGQPAINNVPRQMITQAIRQITDRDLCVTISIPDGQLLARQTYNPKLGIEGGLSILGTTGIVRPYCRKAIADSIRCALDIAAACKITTPVLTPGNIGATAANTHLSLVDQQLIEVGNEWGIAVELLGNYQFESICVIGHPGKLAKLPLGHWNTHSSASESATPSVIALAQQITSTPIGSIDTVEGVLASLSPADRTTLCNKLARQISEAIAQKGKLSLTIAAALININGQLIGHYGELPT